MAASAVPTFRRVLLTLPLRVLWEVLRAFFWPRKPEKPIGYWARDRYGRWELRVPAFRKDRKR
jgi:hypothetical protein